MKKHVLYAMAMALVACLFAACGGGGRMTINTSTRVELNHNVRFVPTLATLQVQAERVTATCHISELDGLNKEQMKQAVVAKALASVKADVLIAPRFTTENGEDGKLKNMTVVGYPATFTAFRSLTADEAPFVESHEVAQDRVSGRMAQNTLTVADVEYYAKQTITLTLADLAGKNEKQALEIAKERLLRQEKADLLFEPQYQAVVDGGTVSAFTLTAFPAKYVNYRPITKEEAIQLQPSKKAEVYYNLTADLQPVGKRMQAKIVNQDPNAKESDLKEQAREAALQKYNADLLLNEQFYVDRQDKVITRITICGTPAVYANFRPLKASDVLDARLNSSEPEEEEQPVSLMDSFKGLFKKK